MRSFGRKKDNPVQHENSPFFEKTGKKDFFNTNHSLVQTKCAECEQEEKLQKKENGRDNGPKGNSIQKKDLLSTNGQPLIQRDDASFETGGLANAIASGTMTPDGLTGQTVYAENCRGLFGCRVGFTFEKAYKGTFAYGAAGTSVKGVYVKIVSDYDHKICGNCDSIRLIQTVRNVTKNRSGNMETADPKDDTRRLRSGWSDPNAPSKGWRVDTLTTLNNPFYDFTAPYDSQVGSPTQSAILWDTPGDWATDTNAGKEFQTFFVCEGMLGDKKTIAGVNWGYYIDDAGDISFRPATPIPFCGPSQELKDAVKRWDAIPGNTPANIDFAEENPVSHEGERMEVWFNFNSTDLRNDATIHSDLNYSLASHHIRQHIMATFLPKIIIHGYASVDGDATYNMELSKKRAESIQAKLIAEGIPAFMIEVVPHGANSDKSPRDLNRRVEIEMTHTAIPFPFKLPF